MRQDPIFLPDYLTGRGTMDWPFPTFSEPKVCFMPGMPKVATHAGATWRVVFLVVPQIVSGSNDQIQNRYGFLSLPFVLLVLSRE